MKNYNYCVLDVFTDEIYQGNPLSVVFTSADLDLKTYENISREFGYSETSFIYFSKEDNALKVRSFTPTGFEVNGAGHNLLGAVGAAILKGMEIFGGQQGKPFVIMKDKVIHLSIDQTNKLSPFIGAMQKTAVIGAGLDSKIIATALNLDPAEMMVDDLVPTVVKTEVAHLMAPVRNLDILNKIIANKALLCHLAKEYDFQGVYCFALLNDDPTYFAQTRFFNPGIGIDEDAATGSAAGPLAGFLYENNYICNNRAYQLLQGTKVNHPSKIHFEVRNEGIWVSGSSIIVMEGTLVNRSE